MHARAQGFVIRDTREPTEVGCDPQHRYYLHATVDWVRLSSGVWQPDTP